MKFENNNQHHMKRDDKKIILSSSVIMMGPCFAVCPLFRFFFLWKGLQKSLPKEAIFTINRYSSQDKTKCSFSKNKSEKVEFDRPGERSPE